MYTMGQYNSSGDLIAYIIIRNDERLLYKEKANRNLSQNVQINFQKDNVFCEILCHSGQILYFCCDLPCKRNLQIFLDFPSVAMKLRFQIEFYTFGMHFTQVIFSSCWQERGHLI